MRPKRINAEQQQAVLDMLSEGLDRELIASRLGLTPG